MTQLATDRNATPEEAEQASMAIDERTPQAASSSQAGDVSSSGSVEESPSASTSTDENAGATTIETGPESVGAAEPPRAEQPVRTTGVGTAGGTERAGGDEPVDAVPLATSTPSAQSAAPTESASAGAPVGTGQPPAADGAGARRQQLAQRLITAFTEQRPIEGKVIGWNKGGFHVTLDGVAAFCPRSLMELGNPRKPAAYLDQTFKFLITNVDEESRRIVVSRKEILEAERRARREEIRKRLSVGAILRGRVESLVDFGAFVDLDGGVKGLVHLSEISRKRVDHPKEALRVGQEVDVKVIKVERGGDRISLSIRALEPDPWDSLEEVYRSGSPFTGKVVRQSEFGLFVAVADGIEGLVHTSQLPLGADMAHPTLKPGETISGWVREVDVSRHRLSLTLRELPASDPWKGIAERYQEGQTVPGKVEHASKFGFFVELEPGLTGLLPFSEVSTPPGRRKENMYHPGQSLTVQILQLDAKRRRISLGSESSKVEGSAADYRAYLKRQQRDTGLNALAAAFEKLKR